MPDVSDSIGEIGGTIRAMLGLTTRNRLRDQIRDTVDLYERAAKHADLSEAAADLAQVISLETKRLLETSTSEGRTWNWASAIVAWVLAFACAFGVYALRTHWPSWWAVLIIIVLGVLGLLLFLVGFTLLFQKKKDAA